MKSEKGFALMQVVLAAGILSVIMLSVATVMNRQFDQTSYLRDQLESIQLIRNFETVLQNTLTCQQTLSGLEVQANGKIIVPGLKDNNGNPLYMSNTIDGRLNIGQITIENQSVTGPDSTGFVKLVIPISRVSNNGGGPKDFRSFESLVSVSVDSAGLVSNCSSGKLLDSCELRVVNSLGDASHSQCCTGDEILVSASAPQDPVDFSFGWTNTKQCGLFQNVKFNNPIHMLCCE